MATPPVFLSVSAFICVHLRLSLFLLGLRSFVRGRVLVLQGTRTNEFDRITGWTGSAGHGVRPSQPARPPQFHLSQ